MSRRPSQHRQKVAKGHSLNGPIPGFKQKPMWWSMCTCGWAQGFYEKQKALDDKESHKKRISEENR